MTYLQLFLNSYRRLHRIHRAGKLGQKIITGRVYDPATILLDRRGYEFSVGCERPNGCFFILPHEATVPLDVSAEDRRELAFHMPSSPDAYTHYWFNRSPDA